ncbi:MAG: hypothetical protein K6E10_04360 [Eubacterium sp.]|nr:hypothetical protein [Eubacterium sp.]
MKILVYGAGAIGSLLIHYLCKAGNDVSLFARSKADMLERDGLVIEHYLQGYKMTVDHPRIVRKVSFEEKYDIVFSVMQGQQQFSVLEDMAKINSKVIVFVGNNLEGDRCQDYIIENAVSKKIILFAFQNSAGHRESGRTVVGRLPVTELFLGGLHSKANPKAINRVKKAFDVKGYKVTEVEDMYSYYWYHAAEIMPYILMCYKVDCDIKKITKSDVKKIVTASSECFTYLKSVGLPVMPKGEDKLFTKGIMGYATYLLYRFMSRTVLGKLMVSDHAKNGIEENIYIDKMIEKFRSSHPGKAMPTWDRLRIYLDKVK